MTIVKKIIGILSLITTGGLVFLLMMAEPHQVAWDTLMPWVLCVFILGLVIAGMTFLGAFNKNDNDEDD